MSDDGCVMKRSDKGPRAQGPGPLGPGAWGTRPLLFFKTILALPCVLAGVKVLCAGVNVFCAGVKSYGQGSKFSSSIFLWRERSMA